MPTFSWTKRQWNQRRKEQVSASLVGLRTPPHPLISASWRRDWRRPRSTWLSNFCVEEMRVIPLGTKIRKTLPHVDKLSRQLLAAGKHFCLLSSLFLFISASLSVRKFYILYLYCGKQKYREILPLKPILTVGRVYFKVMLCFLHWAYVNTFTSTLSACSCWLTLISNEDRGRDKSEYTYFSFYDVQYLMTELVFVMLNVPRDGAGGVVAFLAVLQQFVKSLPESSLRAGRRLMLLLRLLEGTPSSDSRDKSCHKY